jgi:hypothetical protein
MIHSAPTSLAFKVTLSLLQCYFLTFAFTVERSYCAAPLTLNDSGFFVRDTYEFAKSYNPYFFDRPEWLRQATCVHGHLFWILYVAILVGVWIDPVWTMLRDAYVLGLGMKLYALGFYHYMVFSSDRPPPSLVHYFGTEGPYLVSIAAVLYKILYLDNHHHSKSSSSRKRE